MSDCIKLIGNPFKDETYTSQLESEECREFHQTLPNYSKTPLIELNDLSKRLNIKSFQIKDESKRFNLNAFKSLGASYAMAKIIASKTANDTSNMDYKLFSQHKNIIKEMTFVTATDGNHGRAVAWAAENYGCQARVYLPKDTSQYRVDAIEAHGAHAEVTEVNYDDTVAYAARMADENDWILIQDTSWEGYEDIPRDIMVGYQTIIHEYFQESNTWPTHVIIQAGVGSFAAAIFDAFSKKNQTKPLPTFILVEPSGAACFFKSVKKGDGNIHSVKNLETIMAGLSCGVPSLLAWDIIKSTTDYFVVCDDDISISAMKRLANPSFNDPKIVSGESAAVTMGFLEAICTDIDLVKYRENLNISDQSNIFMISTEGDTDPSLYNEIVYGG